MSRSTRYAYPCGHCMVSRAVMAGTRYTSSEGATLAPAAAVAHLARMCSCASHTAPEADPVELASFDDTAPEIRRDGQRILKPGVNVWVQLKRSHGTKRSRGFVVACHTDDTVTIAAGSVTHRVPADEWVKARTGITV